jgi:chemotaxis protein CheX
MGSLTKTASQATVHFDPAWRAILEAATIEVFEMMAGTRPDVAQNQAETPRGELTAMVGMAGALCGMTSVRCSRTAAGKVAALMLGGDAASNPSAAGDALGEICNMVAGNFKSKINTLADHCMLSVPTVIDGQDYSLETAEPTEGMTLQVVLDGEPIWASLIMHA